MLTLLAASDIRCLAVAITSSSWYVDRRCWRSGTHTPYQRPGSRYLHPGVLQGLCRGDPLLGVQGEELLDQVNGWEHEKEQQKERSLKRVHEIIHGDGQSVTLQKKFQYCFTQPTFLPPSLASLPPSPASLPPSLPPSQPPASLPPQPTFLPP